MHVLLVEHMRCTIRMDIKTLAQCSLKKKKNENCFSCFFVCATLSLPLLPKTTSKHIERFEHGIRSIPHLMWPIESWSWSTTEDSKWCGVSTVRKWIKRTIVCAEYFLVNDKCKWFYGLNFKFFNLVGMDRLRGGRHNPRRQHDKPQLVAVRIGKVFNSRMESRA